MNKIQDVPVTATRVQELIGWMLDVYYRLVELFGALTVTAGSNVEVPNNLHVKGDLTVDGNVTVGGSLILAGTMFTPEGGRAVKYINRTGAPSIKGYVVSISPTYDNAVRLIQQNVPDPIGVIYESGVADGAEMWVVITGKADVYYTGSTTRGYLSRGFVTADAGFVAGQAYNEAYPTSPFATDKHFYEIGHVEESRVGAGLALTLLHNN